MYDLSWILADGEDFEDALQDFRDEVENPDLLKARHKQIRKIYNVEHTPEFWADAEGEESI
jgi:hypothetical protein